MNKTKFIGLIFMMVFSIIGIAWVQLIWIRNAVGTQNESFNNAAIASLNDAADNIESSRRMDLYSNLLSSSNNSFDTLQSSVSGYYSMQSYSQENDGNISVRITNKSVSSVPGSEPIVVTYDTTFTSDSVNLVVTSSDSPGSYKADKKVEMSDKNTAYIQQKEFIEGIRRAQNEFQNISNQMISEVYQREMKLDNNEIKYNIGRSLLFANINTPFEFAIIEDGKVSDGLFEKSGKNDFLKSIYKVRLFPDNMIRKDMVLSVIFPERANYVLGSMAWILGASLLFSLIILATFAMSLYFIINQKKVSEMKSDFLNNMTHEFKTPIATISLAADTIMNPKIINDEKSIRHFISMIKKENSRMNKKVETILQIASLDKKEIEFKFENLSIHSIIEHAVEIIEIQVQQRNGTINLDLNASEPVICGDNEHLMNLINNLLDNAIKYSPEAPDIKISTRNYERGVVLSVSDKGIGMSKNVQSRIFERFYRQSSGNVHDVKGFGLGLNYVRAIVDTHKGNIIVFSEPGKGSRFEVFLPFNQENER